MLKFSLDVRGASDDELRDSWKRMTETQSTTSTIIQIQTKSSNKLHVHSLYFVFIFWKWDWGQVEHLGLYGGGQREFDLIDRMGEDIGKVNKFNKN